MRSHSLKYLLITISFAISLISSLRASAKDVFIDSKLSTQEYLATTYGKESKYYIDVLLNNSTEICDTTYHEYYKRMFFQTMAKVVKFRFIVNKKRKL